MPTEEYRMWKAMKSPIFAVGDRVVITSFKIPLRGIVTEVGPITMLVKTSDDRLYALSRVVGVDCEYDRE